MASQPALPAAAARREVPIDVIRDQFAFIVAYVMFVILLRRWAQERLQRSQEETERRRREQEWEYRVGIPYDPDRSP